MTLGASVTSASDILPSVSPERCGWCSAGNGGALLPAHAGEMIVMFQNNRAKTQLTFLFSTLSKDITEADQHFICNSNLEFKPNFTRPMLHRLSQGSQNNIFTIGLGKPFHSSK